MKVIGKCVYLGSEIKTSTKTNNDYTVVALVDANGTDSFNCLTTVKVDANRFDVLDCQFDINVKYGQLKLLSYSKSK